MPRACVASKFSTRTAAAAAAAVSISSVEKSSSGVKITFAGAQLEDAPPREGFFSWRWLLEASSDISHRLPSGQRLIKSEGLQSSEDLTAMAAAGRLSHDFDADQLRVSGLSGGDEEIVFTSSFLSSFAPGGAYSSETPYAGMELWSGSSAVNDLLEPVSWTNLTLDANK